MYQLRDGSQLQKVTENYVNTIIPDSSSPDEFFHIAQQHMLDSIAQAVCYFREVKDKQFEEVNCQPILNALQRQKSVLQRIDKQTFHTLISLIDKEIQDHQNPFSDLFLSTAQRNLAEIKLTIGNRIGLFKVPSNLNLEFI